MYKKSTLLLVAGILVIEAIAIVALRSRVPRPARGIIAAIDVIAAVVLCLLARQKKSA